MKSTDLTGARVTVMGLGLHGGGVAATRFLAEAGADVTVTDLRSEDRLAHSLAAISDLPVRLVLGRHEEEDFAEADLVVKNPAVPRHSPFLQKARRIETDLSLFLGRLSGPLLAITGTKGKSTTAGALHHALRRIGLPCHLGGNITISPLTFLGSLDPRDTVVLELSSFQLGDLAMTPTAAADLRPRVGIVTSFFRDHQDYYGSMESYFKDKAILARAVPPDGGLVLGVEGQYAERFAEAARAPVFWARQTRDSLPKPAVSLTEAGVLLHLPGQERELPLPDSTPESPALRLNLGMTLLALALYGIEPSRLEGCLEGFSGVEHRLEYCGTIAGRRVYNDSAATVPEATLQAVRSFSAPVRLITGGTDKLLDYQVMIDAVGEAAGSYFLQGSGTQAMLRALADAAGAGPKPSPRGGPFDSLEECLDAALGDSHPGDVIVFSPGCASFEKFDNEFHRGRLFKSLVETVRSRS